MQINGLKVIDARKPVKLVITPKDVSGGSTKDPATCAAALACKRELHAEQVRVHIGRTYAKIGDHWVRFQTPESLRSEIIAFDRGGAFAPGEYELKAPSPAQRLGAMRGTKTNQKSPKKLQKPRRSPHIVRGVRQHGANR